ncbi:ROK family protein [Nonomuraea spiralis]|uniref:ROK family transcriptional regulator n=1 Tax=Nonomuraea TaxID=83681 RepID=UPI000F7B22AA|nr:ROK family transcriptional regulator [Nonomuraea sp. WAC 01424]RSN11669.1 ROK family transcriptional regulator [Nonomuraea sp. WAC 01424]
MSQHATLTTLREINASVVLESIRADPPISRAEVSRRTGMTKPTVANALDLLVSAGLVRQAEPPGEMHYGAVYFEPVHTLAHVLALDIGTRFVRGALSDLRGTMLARHDERIDDSDPATILRAAVAVRDALSPGGPPGGVPPGGPAVGGIELVAAGVPGVVDPEEGVIRQSNRPALEGMAIRTELEAALGVPAEVETDANLAVIGEHALGAGRGVADFAFLSIGAGVGAGLILGDRAHRGHRGAAGEVDDPPPGEDELPDSPSGDALMSWARTWIAAGLRDGDTALRLDATPEAIFAAASQGDGLASAIVAEEARRIAARIATISRVVDVELVVLGGGIGLACAGILPEIDAALAGMLRHPPRVEVSALGNAPVLTGGLAHGTRLLRESVATRRISAAAKVSGAAKATITGSGSEGR